MVGGDNRSSEDLHPEEGGLEGVQTEVAADVGMIVLGAHPVIPRWPSGRVHHPSDQKTAVTQSTQILAGEEAVAAKITHGADAAVSVAEAGADSLGGVFDDPGQLPGEEVMPPAAALWPKRCTGTMARVREVIFFRASFTSMLKQTGQTSTKTGVAPVWETQPAVAKKVKAGQSTSSPGRCRGP